MTNDQTFSPSSMMPPAKAPQRLQIRLVPVRVSKRYQESAAPSISKRARPAGSLVVGSVRARRGGATFSVVEIDDRPGEQQGELAEEKREFEGQRREPGGRRHG